MISHAFNISPLRGLLVTIAFVCSGPVIGNSAPASGDALVLAPCQIEDAARTSLTSAECGTLSVPENPANPQGRKILLHVARVPAISRRKAPDPLFLLAGGPGMAASTMYAGAAPVFARIRRERDIILLDQRGTGRSNALHCAFDDQGLLSAISADVVAETRRCLDELRARADVEFYTTTVAVQDLDRVRAMLGYERINLYGGSYGTRVAAHYMRRFPQRVRTAILDGIIAPEQALGPAIALDAQNALDRILTRCVEDTACHERFGDVRETYRNLRNTLKSRSVTVDLADPVTGTPTQLRFGAMHLATVLRLSTYTSEQAALLPLMLHSAHHEKNFVPLAGQFTQMLRTYGGIIAYGMHNSVVCTEDVPFYDWERIDREALARTFIGTSQVDVLRSICEHWPRGPLDADLHAPLKSDIPVLLLSGGNDPVTPAANGEIVRAGLPNSLHLVLEDLGHGQIAVPCMDRVMAQFVERGTVTDLDVTCTRRARPMPFFLSPAGPAP